MSADQQLDQQRLELERKKIDDESALKRYEVEKRLELDRDKALAQAQAKQVPQTVAGNYGVDTDELKVILQSMQENMVTAITASTQQTIQALTVLASQPAEPAKVTVSRDAKGNLVGTIE